MTTIDWITWAPLNTHTQPHVVWRTRESLSVEKEKNEANTKGCQDKRWREFIWACISWFHFPPEVQLLFFL